MTDFSSMDSDWKGVRKNLWWSKISVWLNPSLVAALFVGVVASQLVNFEKSPSFSKANSSDEMATIKNIPNQPEKSTDTYVSSESPQNNVQDESINAQIAIEESKNIESTKRNQTFSQGNENNKSQNVINKKNTVKKTELNAAENALAQGFEENKLNILLAPFAPYVTEHIWRDIFGEKTSIHALPEGETSRYPLADESKLVADNFDYPICINGKKRAILSVAIQTDNKTLESLAVNHEDIVKWLDTPIKKVIIVPQKMINIVI